MEDDVKDDGAYAAGFPVADWHAPADDLAVEAEPAEEVVVEEPAPEPEVVVEVAAPEPVVTASAVVSDAGIDEVSLKACVFKNPYSRKSLTIHHLQRRLRELGFDDAYNDIDGYYGDLTFESVKAFQKKNKLEDTGLMDEETFAAIFKGDPNVKVMP